jgi:hypothetical protein
MAPIMQDMIIAYSYELSIRSLLAIIEQDWDKYSCALERLSDRIDHEIKNGVLTSPTMLLYAIARSITETDEQLKRSLIIVGAERRVCTGRRKRDIDAEFMRAAYYATLRGDKNLLKKIQTKLTNERLFEARRAPVALNQIKEYLNHIIEEITYLDLLLV